MIRGMAKEIGVPIGWLSGCVAADERRGGEWEQRPAAVDPPRGIATGDWTHPAGWPRGDVAAAVTGQSQSPGLAANVGARGGGPATGGPVPPTANKKK